MPVWYLTSLTTAQRLTADDSTAQFRVSTGMIAITMNPQLIPVHTDTPTHRHTVTPTQEKIMYKKTTHTPGSGHTSPQTEPSKGARNDREPIIAVLVLSPLPRLIIIIRIHTVQRKKFKKTHPGSRRTVESRPRLCRSRSSSFFRVSQQLWPADSKASVSW